MIKRLLVGIFCPSVVGGTMAFFILLVPIMDFSDSGMGSIKVCFVYLAWYLFTVLITFVLVGIQSIFFACLMEFVVAKKTQEVANFMLIGSLIGTLSAVFPGLTEIALFESAFNENYKSTTIVIGLITGGLVSKFLHRMHRFDREL